MLSVCSELQVGMVPEQWTWRLLGSVTGTELKSELQKGVGGLSGGWGV